MVMALCEEKHPEAFYSSYEEQYQESVNTLIVLMWGFSYFNRYI